MSEENNPWKLRFELEQKARKESEALLEQKSLELLKINQDLEKTVEQRTQSLNEALINAERANRTKTDFLANISHEIRTPLNAIIGFSEYLTRDKELNEKNKKYASIIESSANSLLGIINDILDFSKIQNGNFDISYSNTDISNISEHVIELFSQKARDKYIKLIFNIDRHIPKEVITDGVRLRQVLSNLLSNAIKFTYEKGTIKINIKLLDKNEKYSNILFEVIDNGIGIPKNKIENIFEPFIQVNHIANKQQTGTGLGLSICSHILKLMNSKLVVESEVGMGSTFKFELKCEYIEIDEDELIEDNKITGLKIFIEDRDSDLYFYAKEYLSLFGDLVYSSFNNIDVVVITYKSKKDLLESRKKFKNTSKLILSEEEIIDLKLEDDEILLSLPFHPSKVNDALCELTTDKKINIIEEESVEKFQGKVLVAEDNSANQELLKLILNDLGIEFTISSNGEEIIKEYEKNSSYDLILMDINMPKINGVEALYVIRTYEEENNLKKTPVVALTANAIKGDKEKFLSLGMDYYLSKPIDIKEFKEVARKYLKSELVGTKNIKEDVNMSINVETKDRLDAKKIADTIGISESIANIIINKFKQEIKKDLAQLKQFVEDENRNEISQKAHYIKNSCLNVALDDVCRLLQDLENKELSMHEVNEKYKNIEVIIELILK